MNDVPKPDAVPPSMPSVSAALFLGRVQLVTLCLLFFVLALYLLEKFQAILQPLLIAFFIAYLILPLHELLVRRGIPSVVAYCVILFTILAVLFGCGTVVYSSAQQMLDRLPEYEDKLEKLTRRVLVSFDVPNAEKWRLRELDLFGDVE